MTLILKRSPKRHSYVTSWFLDEFWTDGRAQGDGREADGAEELRLGVVSSYQRLVLLYLANTDFLDIAGASLTRGPGPGRDWVPHGLFHKRRVKRRKPFVHRHLRSPDQSTQQQGGYGPQQPRVTRRLHLLDPLRRHPLDRGRGGESEDKREDEKEEEDEDFEEVLTVL